MKTALFALFLLAIITSKLPSTTAFVVDTDGDPLRNGGEYYIVPALRGRGGGIGLTKTGNETCPLTVVQLQSELDDGEPLRIASPYRILYIPEGHILNIIFTKVPTCASTPSKWTVVREQPQGWAVKMTGYDNTVDGWFKIERYQSDYKLAFCPHNSDTCANVGIYMDDDGNRLLVLSEEEPFIVMFKKAYSSDAFKRASLLTLKF